MKDGCGMLTRCKTIIRDNIYIRNQWQVFVWACECVNMCEGWHLSLVWDDFKGDVKQTSEGKVGNKKGFVIRR